MYVCMYVIGSAYASVDAPILQSGDKLALQISNSTTTTTTTTTTQSIRPPSSFLLEKTLHQRPGICGAGCFERGERRRSGRHSRLILKWESKRTPITEGEFWAERAENTPEQNGQVGLQVGLVTTPFAVDAYETRPRVRPPTLAVGYPFAASLQREGPLRWRWTLAIPIPRTCEGVLGCLPACLPACLTRKRVKEEVAGPIVNRRKPFSWRGRCLGCFAGQINAKLLGKRRIIWSRHKPTSSSSASDLMIFLCAAVAADQIQSNALAAFSKLA
jgi:hypothetical protein